MSLLRSLLPKPWVRSMLALMLWRKVEKFYKLVTTDATTQQSMLSKPRLTQELLAQFTLPWQLQEITHTLKQLSLKLVEAFSTTVPLMISIIWAGCLMTSLQRFWWASHPVLTQLLSTKIMLFSLCTIPRAHLPLCICLASHQTTISVAKSLVLLVKQEWLISLKEPRLLSLKDMQMLSRLNSMHLWFVWERTSQHWWLVKTAFSQTVLQKHALCLLSLKVWNQFNIQNDTLHIAKPYYYQANLLRLKQANPY